MTLIFPESAADLSDAFNNALRSGAMQREDSDKHTFWARYEFLAHDAEDGVDVFYHSISAQYLRVPRKEEST